MTLSHQDQAALSLGQSMTDQNQDPRLRLGILSATLAIDRWGRDLERDVGEQRYSAFDEAVKEATDAVVEKYTDGEDADVDGIEGYVVEGRVLERELLRDTVEMVVGMIEEESEFDRHTPGPIVEPVGEGGE